MKLFPQGHSSQYVNRQSGHSSFYGTSPIIIVALLMLNGFLGVECWSQSGDLFHEVPSNLKERFVVRLNLLIEYEKSHHWEDLYELLYSGFRQHETSVQYSKRRKHWLRELPEKQVLDFLPHSVRGPDNPATSEWFVFGCISTAEQGHSKKYEGMLNAYYEKEDWYFSEPQIIVGIDGSAPECESSK